MDDIPLTRSFLETLSSEELIKWADHYGIDIPPGLDRVFVIEELLEIAALDMDIEEEYVEEPTGKFAVPAILPKQYNITFIETLVRDPFWVFVYWEIKGGDREIFENSLNFIGYHLKVSPWGRTAPDEIFTVPLTPEDSARYLGFTPANEAKEALCRYYKVDLFVEKTEEEIFLASASPFRLPALSPRIEKQESCIANKFPLIRLSGIEDFHILRNEDREFRTKRSGNPIKL